MVKIYYVDLILEFIYLYLFRGVPYVVVTPSEQFNIILLHMLIQLLSISSVQCSSFNRVIETFGHFQMFHPLYDVKSETVSDLSVRMSHCSVGDTFENFGGVSMTWLTQED